MLNYRGCKGDVINLVPQYMIDISYKTVKPSLLEKLQIIQIGNDLIFQVIFMFSDWFLIKQIIVFPLFYAAGENKFSKTSAWSFEWGRGAWAKMPRFNASSRNVNTISFFFFTWWNIQVKENSASILERNKALRRLKKYERVYPWG